LLPGWFGFPLVLDFLLRWNVKRRSKDLDNVVAVAVAAAVGDGAAGEGLVDGDHCDLQFILFYSY
jgi:hypothetical protein